MMKTLDELTIEDIGKLEPGPETDWLIAQLMPVTDEENYFLDTTSEPYDVVKKLALGRPCGDFCPSDDANDAIRALETHPCVVANWLTSMEKWTINIYDEDGVGNASGNFCMAACKALLNKYLSTKKGM